MPPTSRPVVHDRDGDDDDDDDDDNSNNNNNGNSLRSRMCLLMSIGCTPHWKDVSSSNV